jgi:hypothetical protein
MDNRKNKIIAPIIVTICVFSYFLIMGIDILSIDISMRHKILWIIAPIVIIAAIPFVLIDRIKEIKKGENDDIGQY